MSKSIDERVVSMRFDNKQFESAAATSLSTLDRLKAKLDFRGAAKGLNEITRAADNVSLSGLTKSAEAVEVKFSAMSVVAITAIQKIVDKAATAGAEIVKSLTVTPVSTGFQEYELKMNSVQTIMASTGESLETVMGYLNELNTYADKTIYSFSDMTTNIGKFTNAGVKLEDAVKAIQGISNEAAVSGANANEASRAMYNFAQALSAGYVKLIDWKSIELANMATVEFKNQLLETAAAFGTVSKASDGTYRTVNGTVLSATKNFNETLEQQWLTTDVLVTTLGNYADETTEIGKKAFAAAQDVKTFTQLLDTLKEAAGSGWAETWEIVIGNFEEAKVIWTTASQVIGDMIGNAAEERNAMLRDWKALGGRDSMIRTFGNAWSALLAVILPVRDAIREIFPPTTGQQLANLTKAVERFTHSLILSEEASYTLKVALKALLIPFNLLFQLSRIGVSAFASLISYTWGLIDAFLAFPSKTKHVSSALQKVFGDSRYERAAQAVTKITERVIGVFVDLGNGISDVFELMSGKGMDKVQDAFETLTEILEPIGDWVLDRIVDGLERIANFEFSSVINFGKDALSFVIGKLNELLNIASPVTNAVKGFVDQFKMGINTDSLQNLSKIFGELKESIRTFDLGSTFEKAIDFLKKGFEGAGEAAEGFVGMLEKVAEKIDPVKLMIFAFGVSMTGVALSVARSTSALAGTFDAVTGTLNGFTGVLTSIQKRLVPSKFQQLAYAIGVLAGALVVISLIDASRVQQATISILGLMAALTVMVGALAAIDRFIAKSDDFSERLRKMGVGMTLMAAAIVALSVAVAIISRLDIGGFAKGLLGVVVLMAALTAASVAMAKFAPVLSKNALFLIAFAASITMVINSLEKLANINLDGIEDNLGNLRVIMMLLLGVAAIASRIKFGAAAGIGVLAVNLLLFVKVMQILGKIDASDVAAGLGPLIPVMALVAALSIAAQKATVQATKAGGSVLLMSAAVLVLVEAIKQIADIDPAIAAKGTIVIAAMFAMFTLLSKSMQVINKGQKLGGLGKEILVMSAAILALSLAIRYIGSMDASMVAKGTLAVTALLAMFAVIGKVGQTAKGSIGYIVTLTLAIGVLTTAMTLFTLLPADELAYSTVALIAMLTAFGTAMKLIGSMDMTRPIRTAVSIGVMLAALSIALKVLTEMDVSEALASSLALSSLIVAVSAATNLMRGTDWKGALTSAAAMALVLTETTVALWALSQINSSGMLEKATSLSLIIAAVSAAALALSYINAAGIGPGLASFAALIAGLSAAVLAIGALMSDPAFQQFASDGTAFLTGLDVLIPTILKMAAVSAALSLLGVVAGPALTGAGALAVIVAGLTGVIAALGGLSSLDGFDEIINDGSRIFTQLGSALGSFIGNVVGSLVGGIISGGAVSAASGLSVFSEKIQPFLANVKNIDDASVSGAANLAKVILAMTGASFIDGIADFLNLKGDLSSIGDELSEFADPMASFINTIAAIGVEKINATASAVSAIASLISAIPSDGGLMGLISGDKDMGNFASGLSALGNGIASYWAQISRLDIDQAVIDASVSAAASINDLVTALPTTGGKFQEWFGEKDLGNFASKLSALANGLVAYATIIGNANLNTSLVTSSAAAAKSIAALSDNLPSTGGKLQEWFGGKDLSGFAASLSELGVAIAGYYTSLTGVSYDADLVTKSAESIKSLLDILLALPKSGGFGDVVSGSQSLGTFGIQIRSLGDAMLDFNDDVSKMDLAAIQAAVDIITSLATGIEQQKSKIETEAITIVDIFTDAVKDKIPDFKMVGNDMVQGLIDGVNQKKSSFTSTVKALCQAGVDIANDTFDINSPSKVFYQIGGYLVQGIINGIRDNASEANTGMSTLGTGLITAIQNVLGIHSPSTVARDEVGRYIVKGIAEGITSDMSAEEAAKQKATNIVNAFKEQLDSIDLSMTTVDLEHQLWSNLFGGVEEKDNEKELEATKKKLELQSEKVGYANAEYQATLKALGATADETREAYNKFLQEKITLSELAQTYYDLQNTVVVNQQDALKQYGEILRNDQEVFKLMGWTQDQIREYAAKQVGLDPTTLTTAAKAQFDSVKEIFDFYMTDVEVVIEQTVSAGVNKANQKAASGGQQIGSNVSSGIANGLNSNTGKVSEAAGNLSNAIKDGLSGVGNFEGSATSVIDGLLNGLNNKITDLGDAGVNLFSSLENGFNSAAEIHSPSKKMYENGVYLVEGLTNGINDSAHMAADALAKVFLMGNSDTGETTIPLFMQKIIEGLNSQYGGLVSTISQFMDDVIITAVDGKQESYYQNGYDLSVALVNGIRDGFKTTYETVFAEIKGLLSQMEAEVQARIARMRSQLGGVSVVMSSGTGGGARSAMPQVMSADYTPEPQVRALNDFTPTTSSFMASGIAGAMDARSAQVVNETTNNVYNNYTQNNYSPKALSRLDIYRQSKNLFALQKGLVNG